MRKRITFTLLILSLIFSNFGFDTVAAKKKDNEETIIDNVEYTVVQDENGDNLLQLKYLDTGKVEFVKTVVEDDVYTNVVVSSEGEVLNKVEYVKDEEKIYIDGKVADGKLSLTSTEDSGPTYASVDPGGGGSKWKYLSTSYGSNSEKLTHQSLMVTFVAAALMLPAWSQIVIGVVNTLWSAEVTQIWYKRYNYVDAYATYTTCKRANSTYFYRVSNYTGLLRSTGIVVQPIDPCNSGY